MQARNGPVGPQGSREQIGPVGLLWRGARESYRTGAYKAVRTPLGYRGGTKHAAPHLRQRTPFSTGWWLQPVLKAPPLVPVGATTQY